MASAQDRIGTLAVVRVVWILLLCAVIVGRGAAARAGASPGPAAAGPALAGDAIVWGQQRRDGSLAVLRKPLGRPPRVLHRIPALKARNRVRSFSGLPGALSASTGWVAYGLNDATVQVDGDSFGVESSVRAFGSRGGGRFRSLLPRCDGAAYIATASEGDAVLIGQAGARCGGRDGTRVWLIEGARAPRLLYESRERGLGMRQVQMAGTWVAWSEGGHGVGDERITVAERASGKVVARYTTKDFAGGRGFRAFDIDDEGNVVALSGPQPRCYYDCVTVRNIRANTKRTISHRASHGSVAIAAGRIAFVERRRLWPRRIVLTDLSGRVLRHLDRFGRARRPLGDLALSRDRIAWAVLRGERDAAPGAPGSIETARLR